MTKRLVAYSTRWNLTTRLVKLLANSVYINDKNWQTEMYHINHFEKNGIPENTSAILSYGILRGTGLAFKEAAKNNIDRYYMDHAYFDGGFKDECWLRILKNKHTINYVKDVPSDRWNKFFKKKYNIQPWGYKKKKNGKILIIPPSNAICWYFNEYNWLDNLLSFFKENYEFDIFKKIKIRKKPNEPIVDKQGNFLGIDKNTKSDPKTLDQDLEDALIVIAYNSQVALEATIRGIPVVVDHHNCCNSITFDLKDITNEIYNPKFDTEPDRKSLFQWLSYCQFNYKEIKSGDAWRIINEFQ